MIRGAIVFVVLLALVLGALYVLLFLPQRAALDEARRDASLRAQEAATLQSRVTDLENLLDDLRQTSAELEARVKEREGELAQLLQTQDELLGELEQEIADGQIQNVTRFLQEEVGMEPTRLSAAAMSEYQPRNDNDTNEGRQSNRRIEIVLAPLPEAAEDTETITAEKTNEQPRAEMAEQAAKSIP